MVHASSKSIIVFMGPPGAGKGALSARLEKELGWIQVSTGDLCRRHIADETEIGRSIDFAIKSGKLVSDSLIVDMVRAWFAEHQKNEQTVILDGFPRTVPQGILFRDFLRKELPAYQLSIVKLVASEDAVLKRLGGRITCSNKKCQAVYSLLPGSSLAPQVPMTCDKCSSSLVKRTDDEDEAIKKRLAIHAEHESALLSFYQEAGYVVLMLNAEQAPDDVFTDFKRLVGV